MKRPKLLLQTVEEIAEIVKQAQTPPAGPAGWDQDEYIGAPLVTYGLSCYMPLTLSLMPVPRGRHCS